MVRRSLLALTALIGLVHAAHAADIQISYRVDAKSLKSTTPAGTPLTFQLFTDSACTTSVGAAQVVNVENVALIEQPKLIKVKNGPKPPQVAEISYTMTGITPAPAFYAKVTGTGITAIGAACQFQGAGARPAIAVAKDGAGKTIGPVSSDSAGTFTAIFRDATGYSYPLGVTQEDPDTGVQESYLFAPYGQGLFYQSSDCSGPALIDNTYTFTRPATVIFDGAITFTVLTPVGAPTSTTFGSHRYPTSATNCVVSTGTRLLSPPSAPVVFTAPFHIEAE